MDNKTNDEFTDLKYIKLETWLYNFYFYTNSLLIQIWIVINSKY